MSIGGKNYLATGDISPTSLLTSSCFVFNKNLFTDYDMEFPYTMAAEGKWTLDQLIRMTKGLSVDFNGDGKMERDSDLFSLSCWSQDISISLFYGAGGMLSAKNEDDIPVIQWDVDRISSIYDKVYELIIDNKSNFVIDSKEYPTTYQTFSNGGAFFCEITLQKIDAFLRDMEDDYGILPLPKWDEAQPTYLSCVGGAGGFVVVPAIVSDPERTGMIFEALAAGAYDGITPSLYDVITKTRNVRDTESAQMVSLITSQRVFDPYLINMIDGYDFILQLLKNGGREVASTLEKSRSAAESKLQSIIDSYLVQN